MEQLTMVYLELSYDLPISVEKLFKVKKVGLYPMNGFRQINNK